MFTNVEQLLFEGMSYEFHGENHGAPISAYIVNAPPGKGPPLHTHPYVEAIFTIEGRAIITISDENARSDRRRNRGCSCKHPTSLR